MLQQWERQKFSSASTYFFLTDLESAYNVNPEKDYAGRPATKEEDSPPLRSDTSSHKARQPCFPGTRHSEITEQICIKLFFSNIVG